MSRRPTILVLCYTTASIGQVYKARIRPGKQLEAAIGLKQAKLWGGKTVAIKVQRPDVEASASLDMYLLRRSAMWIGKTQGNAQRGSTLTQVADAFGMQLFGELDYVREANNCDRFRALYGSTWDDVLVPAACTALTRRRVLVMEWVDGYVLGSGVERNVCDGRFRFLSIADVYLIPPLALR